MLSEQKAAGYMQKEYACDIGEEKQEMKKIIGGCGLMRGEQRDARNGRTGASRSSSWRLSGPVGEVLGERGGYLL